MDVILTGSTAREPGNNTNEKMPQTPQILIWALPSDSVKSHTQDSLLFGGI